MSYCDVSSLGGGEAGSIGETRCVKDLSGDEMIIEDFGKLVRCHVEDCGTESLECFISRDEECAVRGFGVVFRLFGFEESAFEGGEVE